MIPVLLLLATVMVAAAPAKFMRAQNPLTDPSIVNTPNGPVQGILNPIAREFRGIPYAQPPVNDLRFSAPLPAEPWGPKVLQATQDGPGCIQPCALPPHTCPPVTSEDCLYLNVFTPLSSSTPLPVALFIHGGDFKAGYGGGLLYNSSWLVQEDVIIVALNYRLGALGFSFTNTSNSDPSNAIPGNLGLMDQALALQWIRNNIASFGGDPNQVSIFGQSAGAMSVASLLVSPYTRDGIYAAIMESEPFALPFRDPANSLQNTLEFAGYCGCYPPPAGQTVEQCLRSPALTPETILNAQIATAKNVTADLDQIVQIFLDYSPTVGTDFLPNHPMLSFNGVPGSAPVGNASVVLGTVGNEGLLFIYEGFNFTIPSFLYEALVAIMFPFEDAGEILSVFPVPDPAPEDMRPLLSNLTSAAMFYCAVRNASVALAAQPTRTAPVYAYTFPNVLSASPYIWGPNFTFCIDYSCHSEELTSVFYATAPEYNITFTPTESTLSRSIMSYWGNVFKTGSPSTGNSANPMMWEPLQPGSPYQIMNLITSSNPSSNATSQYMLQNPWADICDVFDKVGYNWY